ncbi:MAG: GxxExxY protein [Opitutus sp.]|nr:GxxExxY protein [Opitutus sp.]
MPIRRTLSLRDLTQPEFDTLDAIVMRHAYASQNKFGRMFDERVYENDLAQRLRGEGFEVHTQVPVSVLHGTFEKTYFLDLVVNQMLYELKTVAALLAEHQAQGLHYAMLRDIRRVKLLNFRSAKVQGDLVYNAVTEAGRHAAQFCTDRWRPLSDACPRLVALVRSLVADCGTHLSSRLYNGALVHCLGGEEACLQRIAVSDSMTTLGTHMVQFHGPGIGFVVTAITRHTDEHRRHLQCLLDHLALKGIQWINFNHAQVELRTLTR